MFGKTQAEEERRWEERRRKIQRQKEEKIVYLCASTGMLCLVGNEETQKVKSNKQQLKLLRKATALMGATQAEDKKRTKKMLISSPCKTKMELGAEIWDKGTRCYIVTSSCHKFWKDTAYPPINAKSMFRSDVNEGPW